MLISAPLVILGQITSAAFAAGLNLYLTVALIGASSRLNLLPALPPGLQGLENTVVVASALALYLIEFVVDKIPHLDTAWDALHTVIRPLGTAALTLLALDGTRVELQIGAAAVAGSVALGAHAAKAGFRLVVNRSPSRIRTSFVSTFEDLCAAALAVLALLFPVAAMGVGAGAVLILALVAPRLQRAAALVARAFFARLRAFFGSPGWRPVHDLPLGLRNLVDAPPLGRAQPRAVRAAVKGVPGIAAYRSGWVVICYDRTAFLYRSISGYQSFSLPDLQDAELKCGTWTDAVTFRLNSGRRCTLFLLKDGPAAEVAVADLTGAT